MHSYQVALCVKWSSNRYFLEILKVIKIEWKVDIDTITFVVPDIESIVTTSNDGMIMVTSVLQNTAGVENDTIAVQITCYEEGQTDMDSQLVSDCPASCFDEDLTITAILGPIIAGTTYQCTIRVETMCGSNMLNSEKFNSSEGRKL